MSATTSTCLAGHPLGDRPDIAPLADSSGRMVVRHGRDYLDAAGDVYPHPVRFDTFADAEHAIALHEQGLPELVRCTHCGMRADLDPELHSDRYAHWPTVRCATCTGDVPFGGPAQCELCDLHDEPMPEVTR